METNQTTAKVFSPSYDGGLEIMAIDLGHGDHEFRVRMKKNHAFVAMTRSTVDANAIAAIPEMIDALKEAIAYSREYKGGHLVGASWRESQNLTRMEMALAKAEGRS